MCRHVLYIGHRRRHVYCAGIDVPVLRMTASAESFPDGTQHFAHRMSIRTSMHMSIHMSARLYYLTFKLTESLLEADVRARNVCV